MDKSDIIILQKLAENADITAAELVPFVNLSIPSINKRIDKLKKTGIIKNFTVNIDSKLIGKPIKVFILINIDSAERVEQLKEYVLGNPDILEFYSVTGNYDFVVKACLDNLDSLEMLLSTLKRRFGVVKTQTMMGLTEHKFIPSPVPQIELVKEEQK